MLILRKDAEQDIKDAYEWYEERRLHLGAEFLAELESTFDKIEENPKLFSPMSNSIRRALCQRFPYAVYFIENTKNTVVLGVLHQRRNPSAWKSRR